MKTLKQLLVGISMAGIVALPAAADCSGLDSLGAWKFYVRGLTECGVTVCDIHVWFGGQIRSGVCNTTNLLFLGELEFPVLGGDFSVNNECEISGVIESAGFGFILDKGRMNIPKTVANGLGTAFGTRGDFEDCETQLMFSAVRQ